mmetsp:Transcript_4412/g.14006  ORF Transcript_4412/g.14006 Transcript_4412/m.14006 type:complete len:268 (+) Transcript_4412:185-988(+)
MLRRSHGGDADTVWTRRGRAAAAIVRGRGRPRPRSSPRGRRRRRRAPRAAQQARVVYGAQTRADRAAEAKSGELAAQQTHATGETRAYWNSRVAVAGRTRPCGGVCTLLNRTSYRGKQGSVAGRHEGHAAAPARRAEQQEKRGKNGRRRHGRRLVGAGAVVRGLRRAGGHGVPELRQAQEDGTAGLRQPAVRRRVLLRAGLLQEALEEAQARAQALGRGHRDRDAARRRGARHARLLPRLRRLDGHAAALGAAGGRRHRGAPRPVAG